MAVEHSRRKVKDLLDGAESPGDACVGGAAPELPALPGLEVAGVGPIPLPLTEPHARALAGVAEQAPHGQGPSTVVDTSIRNTLQIDPSKVTLANPAWGPALLQRVEATAEAMGVHKGAVRAELYKLLLYEPGGFFRAHRDTEKAEGMFGTLAIQLPSLYTGGALEVRHAGKQRTFTMGSGGPAAYGCQYVALYADCEHEIKPVESGYRLALIYSLCYTGAGEPPSVEALGCLVQLEAALKGLPEEDSLLVLPLAQQYTPVALGRLGVGCLKGTDRTMFKALKWASDGEFVFHIVVASRTDVERGEERYHGFDTRRTERGDPRVSQAFTADGSNASTAVTKLIDWTSCDQGGTVLGSQEDVCKMWGQGTKGQLMHPHTQKATREVYYCTSVLLAYPKAGELHLLMNADVSGVVQREAEHPTVSKLSRIVAFLQRHGAKDLKMAGYEQLVAALGQVYAAADGGGKRNVVGMLRTVLCELWPAAASPATRSDPSLTIDITLTAALVDAIIGAVRACGWIAMRETVLEFIDHVRACEQQTIPQRADLVARLKALGGPAELLATLADDLLTVLEAPLGTAPRCGWYSDRPVAESRDRADVLTCRSVEVLFQAGLSTGQETHLLRFNRWALMASEPELKTAVAALPGESTAAAADACDRIVKLQRSVKLRMRQTRRVQLEAATARGQPAFTWAMPEASGGAEWILEFLRSPQPGPLHRCVGGGIKHARSIAASLEKKSKSGCSFEVGVDGTGAEAEVIVTKTKAYYNGRVAKYHADKAELLEVQIAELLDGEASAVDADKDAAAADGPVCKKARTSHLHRRLSAPPTQQEAVK